MRRLHRSSRKNKAGQIASALTVYSGHDIEIPGANPKRRSGVGAHGGLPGYAGSVKNAILAFGAITLACCGALFAQEGRVSIDAALRNLEKPYVQATGQATVSVKPDRAVIDIGVTSDGPTAEAAAADNAKRSAAVLAALESLLGAKKNLQTTSYSVQPKYTYPKPGAAPVISGYTATNVVEVTLDDLTLVSKVIDSATRSGANVIQSLQYQLRNPAAVRAQALRKAAEDAKQSAEAIAAGLGVKSIRVLSAEEITPQEGFVAFKRAAPLAAEAAQPTPVEVGMIDVSVKVLLRLEIGQ